LDQQGGAPFEKEDDEGNRVKTKEKELFGLMNQASGLMSESVNYSLCLPYVTRFENLVKENPGIFQGYKFRVRPSLPNPPVSAAASVAERKNHNNLNNFLKNQKTPLKSIVKERMMEGSKRDGGKMHYMLYESYEEQVQAELSGGALLSRQATDQERDNVRQKHRHGAEASKRERDRSFRISSRNPSLEKKEGGGVGGRSGSSDKAGKNKKENVIVNYSLLQALNS
jgi:hypothetical protein